MTQKKGKTRPLEKTISSGKPNPVLNDALGWKLPEWTGVLLVMLLIAYLRWQYLDIPLERDESVYAYQGKCALDGDRPYFDFYEMKPPGLFYTYALLIGIFGYSAKGVHMAALFVTLLNALFTYLIGRKIAGKNVGLIASLTYGILSLHPGASGAHLMSESVSMIWGLPGVLLALYYPDRTRKGQLFLSGVLLSLAVLVKQTTAVFVLAMPVWWAVAYFSRRNDVSLLAFARPLLWWALGGIAPLLAFWALIYHFGTLAEAKYWLFDYAALYSTSVADSVKIDKYFLLAWRLMSEGYWGYFIGASAGLLALWFAGLSAATRAFLLVWTILSAATVLPGYRFYGHYWITAFPALSIAGAMVFMALSKRLMKTEATAMHPLLLAGGLLWGAHAFATMPHVYFKPKLAWFGRAYAPGNTYAENQVMSNYLSKKMKPTDTLAVFGSDLQYFIYLGKKSPFRHVYMPFIIREHPFALRGRQELKEELLAKKPQYVVFMAYSYGWMYKTEEQKEYMLSIYNILNRDYDFIAYMDDAGKAQKVMITEVKTGQESPQNKGSFIAVYKRK